MNAFVIYVCIYVQPTKAKVFDWLMGSCFVRVQDRPQAILSLREMMGNLNAKTHDYNFFS